MGHAADSIDTVMRDDESSPPLSVGDVLANAPRREGDYFRVRAILD
jgi:Asp-tRNA(Asn)/Glu-tRNA(Gln) amidotransferase C subunit